jgi:chorismate-pyruvate lyase
LQTLVGLFYDHAQLLGSFEEVNEAELTPTARKLLAHNSHMTVTVEDFHASPVDVEVLERSRDGEHYARKILLRKQVDERVVQFGIVRLNRQYLGEQVLAEIESETIPLGRVLINHNVLRVVQLVALWKIVPGPDLRTHMDLADDTPIFGRTALIYCNGEPGIELLEIVTPA